MLRSPRVICLFGAGASFAALISHFPQLIWISKQKNILFILAGLALAVSKTIEIKNNKIAAPKQIN